MGDRIDELVDEAAAGWQDCPSCGQRPRYRGIRPVISWDVEADGPTCADPWHGLHPDAALTELATIAREAEARAKRFEDKYEWDETTIAALHDSEETLVADWRIADAMPKQQQWEVGPVTCVQHDWRLVASGTAGNRYTCVNCGATRTEV